MGGSVVENKFIFWPNQENPIIRRPKFVIPKESKRYREHRCQKTSEAVLELQKIGDRGVIMRASINSNNSGWSKQTNILRNELQRIERSGRSWFPMDCSWEPARLNCAFESSVPSKIRYINFSILRGNFQSAALRQKTSEPLLSDRNSRNQITETWKEFSLA
jgi:hypothetical protein